jgi:hypothetical protein
MKVDPAIISDGLTSILQPLDVPEQAIQRLCAKVLIGIDGSRATPSTPMGKMKKL